MIAQTTFDISILQFHEILNVASGFVFARPGWGNRTHTIRQNTAYFAPDIHVFVKVSGALLTASVRPRGIAS